MIEAAVGAAVVLALVACWGLAREYHRWRRHYGG